MTPIDGTPTILDSSAPTIKEPVFKQSHRSVSSTLNRTSLQRLSRRPTVLDLFAGAGGLSEGFIKVGCEIVGHIEMDNSACRTLVTRMIYHELVNRGKLSEYKDYVLGKVTLEELIEKYGLQKQKDSVIRAKIGEDNCKQLIAQIKKRLSGRPLDMIVGGPPCQAYSYIGRSRDIENMRSDERNFLYKYYVEFLKELQPKIFVFENVPGLKTAGGGKYLKEMRKLMKRAGYDTDFDTLNAADFGVPQNRKRIILVGWNKNSGLKEYPQFKEVQRNYKVKDFFSDLPRLYADENRMIQAYSNANELLTQLGIVDPQFDILFDHVTRPHNKRDLEIYKRAALLKRQGKNIKYNTLPEHLKTHKNETGFLDRFKVVNINAAGSHTVVAHIGRDGHFYIHPDPNQNRSLSVREAARLQTFPDDYKFEGARGPRFKQIGNAVPPMLAAIIANTILGDMTI